MILDKIRQRQKSLEISTDDIAGLLSMEACKVQKYFESGEASREDIEKITVLLGLDIFGNELFEMDVVVDKRAEQKAIYIVSLVQDTSSLENQGLDAQEIKQLLQKTKEQFLSGEYRASLWKK